MHETSSNDEHLYFLTRDALIEQGVIFFGGYGSVLYSEYINNKSQKYIRSVPDFDVLSEDPETTALILTERLTDAGFKNIKTVHHPAIGELIPERIEILVGKDTISFIFKPIACHSYNTIRIRDKEINVATIDTILSFYLAFIYTDKPYFNKDRILCMAQFLFEVEENNRLHQTGLLKRFTMKCYGKQETLETIRALKTEMYKKLADKRGTREYEMWFLKYNPSLNKEKEEKKLEITGEKQNKTQKKRGRKSKSKSKSKSMTRSKSTTIHFDKLFS
jgi:hypothetical protein